MSDTLFDSEVIKGALFSECRTWRYSLLRQWGITDQPLMVMFVGVNPSKADEKINDRTVSRCIQFARDWGYDGMYMMNAYAFMATDPDDMRAAAEPIGKRNDWALRIHALKSDKVVAAWGMNCEPDRERAVCRVIDRPMYCLGKTKDGRPRHPLYVRGDKKLELYWEPE